MAIFSANSPYPYGQSKKAAEELLLAYGRETGANGMIYRLPNLFGKWCRPNYNSVVATFCHHIARDLPITVSDPAVELELVYIDDLINEILNAMEGHPHRTDGAYCGVPVSHPVTLGEIVHLLRTFREQPQTLLLPEIPDGSFEKKLYSTYLSYLPPEKIAFPLKMNVDERGSFTELLKTKNCGQISVNITKPGITKGQHWHNSKWEFFMVVAGHGLIQERRIGSDEKIEFEVSGDRIQAVHMLPGYTHNIINLSETENLVTVMWANEQFDPDHPDIYKRKTRSQLMDDLDHKIIQLLAENARMPVKDIAQQVNLTSPAVSSRIHRLEQEGIIGGYTVVLRHPDAPARVEALISVLVDAATRASFLAMIEQESQVLQCFRVTGSYNFIIKVSCTDIDALEHLLTKMQKMGSTNTQIILNTQLDRGLAFDE